MEQCCCGGGEPGGPEAPVAQASCCQVEAGPGLSVPGKAEAGSGPSTSGQTSSQPQPQEPSCCCGRQKDTPRGAEFQADLQRRLNRAIGQLNGVKAMIDANRYCADVLTQLAAAESAVHRVSELILRNHMQTCVIEQVRAGNDEVIDEAMDLIHRFGGR